MSGNDQTTSAATYLAGQGWSADQITAIMRGRKYTSVQQLTAPQVDATVTDSIPAHVDQPPKQAKPSASTSGLPAPAASSQQPPSAKPGSSASSASSAPPPSTSPSPTAAAPTAPAPAPAPPVDVNGNPIGQKSIVDAIWASLSAGDPTPLAAIARQLDALPAPLRAYALAASREGPRVYQGNQDFIKEFNKQQADQAAGRAQDAKTGEGVASASVGIISAVAVAAAAANAVPVVGQAVSAILAAGLALAVALTEGFKLPERKGEDQIHDAVEGLQVFYGIGVDPPENPYEDTLRTLKDKVVQDPISFALPQVPLKTSFPFAPSYEAYKEAATELGLYNNGGSK